MKVGIVGLGLIGGSMAKAYKKAGHTVAAYDRDNAITEFAMLDGAAVQISENVSLYCLRCVPKRRWNILKKTPHIYQRTQR